MSKANKIFGYDGSENTTAYHSITADHPFMREIGLGVFTTGTLYNWWYTRNGRGKYVNRELVAGEPENRSSAKHWGNPAVMLYGSFASSDGGHHPEISLSPWRVKTKDGAGKYETQKLEMESSPQSNDYWNWKSKQNNPMLSFHSSYNIKDILNAGPVSSWGAAGYFDYWDYKTNSPKFSTVLRLANSKNISIAHAWTLNPGNENLAFYEYYDPVLTLIDMNNYINALQLAQLDKSKWTKKQLAMLALLQDIKSSKEGGVKYSTEIAFNINLAGGRISCVKVANVDFTLKLFDHYDRKKQGRSLAVGSMVVVKPPADALGRSYDLAGSSDGALSNFPDEDPTKEVAGELDMSFNKYTGKWESGSPQLVAVVTQALPAAQRPDFLTLKEASTKEMLDKPGTDKAILYGSGLAMPIDMQNGNPAQWTPTYLRPNLCPDDDERDDKDKTELKVYNNSKIPIATDTTVILSRIEGLWMAQPLGEEPEDFAIVPKFEGKWSFDYHATNVLHMHRDAAWKRTTGDQVEKKFHVMYYGGRSVYLDAGPEALNAFDVQLDVLGPRRDPNDAQGIMSTLYQFSSFDFMEPEIGGTRNPGESDFTKPGYSNTRSLCGTNPVMDTLSNPLPVGYRDDESENAVGFTNGVFFGCMFPDGYESESYAHLLTARDYNAAVASLDWGYKNELTQSDAGNAFPPFIGAIGKDTIPVDFTEEGDRSDPISKVLGDITDLPEGSYFHYNPDVTYPIDEGVLDADGIPVGNPLTMFAGGNIDQLPADIGTNANYDGTWGQPIRNMRLVEQMYVDGEDQNDLLAGILSLDNYGVGERSHPQALARQVITNGNFMAKEVLNADGNPDATDVSNNFFDIKPRKPNRIMFCPLKLELYASVLEHQTRKEISRGDSTIDGHPAWFVGRPFDYKNYATWAGQSLDTPGVSRVAKGVHFHRIAIAAEYAVRSKSKHRPTSAVSQEREYEGMTKIRYLEDGSMPKLYTSAYDEIDKGYTGGLIDADEIGELEASMFDDHGLAYSSSLPAEIPHQQVAIPGYIPANKNVPQGMWMDEKAFSDGLQWVHGGLNDNYFFMQPQWFHNSAISQSSKGCAGAGAFGVIGAVATTSANTAVSFNVTDALGTWSWIGRSFDKPANTSISFGFAGGGTAIPIITSVTSAAEFSIYRQPSWGPDATPWAWNTSVLAVMLYHAWPREQTIYDSRFMAVHHFNPDIETMDYYHNLKDTDGTTNDDRINIQDVSRYVEAEGVSKGGVLGINSAVVASGTDIDVLNSDGELETQNVPVDQIGSAVDYRVPSYYNIDTGEIHAMENSMVVYSDAITDPYANIGVLPDDELPDFNASIIDSEYWKVSSERRGKLLPYRYYPKSIGVAVNHHNLDFKGATEGKGYIAAGNNQTESWPDDDESSTIKVENVDVIVHSLGTGYKIGDTFKLSIGAGSLIMQVEAVGAGNSVSSLAFLHEGAYGAPEIIMASEVGEDLAPEDFLNKDDEVGPGTTSSVGVEPITVNGEGFEIYFTRGMVSKGTARIDEKPKLASSSRYQVISQQPPGNTLKAATDDVGYGQQNRTVSVSIENPSEDNRYDIFFRFHNDVSHTIMSDNWCIHNGGERLGTQQFCDVTITAV